MKTYLECVPCFFRQAVEAAKIAGASEKQQREILLKIAKALPRINFKSPPPEVGRVIYKIIHQVTKQRDIYRRLKDKSIRQALRLYPKLKKIVNQAADKLLVAVELAIAGNIIDYGVSTAINVDQELKKILHQEKEAILKNRRNFSAFKKLKRLLQKAKTVLFLGDNAGETVFDRILLEEIKRTDKHKQIIYAVKEQPIINDALKREAVASGIDKTAQIISCGADTPGVVLSRCSKKFLKIFKEADLVISKGQGNFEALSSAAKRPIFFLFMAKCPVVAREMNCSVREIILLFKSKR